jgi:hypothetical protein
MNIDGDVDVAAVTTPAIAIATGKSLPAAALNATESRLARRIREEGNIFA